MAVGRSLDRQPFKWLNPLNFHKISVWRWFGVIVSNTVTTRLLRRVSHGNLTVISRLSQLYLAAILRLSCGYPFDFSNYFVGQKQTITKMPLSCGAGPVAATRLSLPT